MRARQAKLNGVALAVGVMALMLATAGSAFGHCDSVDGPVVKDAQAALDKGDVTGILKWVSKADEEAIRKAFQNTLIVRAKGPEAKALADMYFFETLVRVHRAGEGAPYTGIKPAGTPLPEAIAKSDEAVEHGTVDELAKRVAAIVEGGIRERFSAVAEARKHKDESVDAGRNFVAAYVEFIHYVERIHDTAAASAGAHGGHETAAAVGEPHPQDKAATPAPRHEH